MHTREYFLGHGHGCRSFVCLAEIDSGSVEDMEGWGSENSWEKKGVCKMDRLCFSAEGQRDEKK